jgi:DNA topoisomerase II
VGFAADSKSGRKFRQVFSKNMSDKSEPRITASKDDYTQITFRPDLAKFNMTAIDDDFEALVRKRVQDMAGCCPGVKV